MYRKLLDVIAHPKAGTDPPEGWNIGDMEVIRVLFGAPPAKGATECVPRGCRGEGEGRRLGGLCTRGGSASAGGGGPDRSPICHLTDGLASGLHANCAGRGAL